MEDEINIVGFAKDIPNDFEYNLQQVRHDYKDAPLIEGEYGSSVFSKPANNRTRQQAVAKVNGQPSPTPDVKREKQPPLYKLAIEQRHNELLPYQQQLFKASRDKLDAAIALDQHPDPRSDIHKYLASLNKAPNE